MKTHYKSPAPGFPLTCCHHHGFTITHVDAPNGVTYPCCLQPTLNDIILQVTHERLPSLVWRLMIPESFLGQGRLPRCGFCPCLGMTWRRAPDRLFFASVDFRKNNIKNPCTDVWPWFGRLEPGETKTVTGRLYFLEGQVPPEQMLARYHADWCP